MKLSRFIYLFLIPLAACAGQTAVTTPQPKPSASVADDAADRLSLGNLLAPAMKRDLFLSNVKTGKAPGNCADCDLSNQDLRQARFDLGGSDLSRANLRGAQLPVSAGIPVRTNKLILRGADLRASNYAASFPWEEIVDPVTNIAHNFLMQGAKISDTAVCGNDICDTVSTPAPTSLKSPSPTPTASSSSLKDASPAPSSTPFNLGKPSPSPSASASGIIKDVDSL